MILSSGKPLAPLPVRPPDLWGGGGGGGGGRGGGGLKEGCTNAPWRQKYPVWPIHTDRHGSFYMLFLMTENIKLLKLSPF